MSAVRGHYFPKPQYPLKQKLLIKLGWLLPKPTITAEAITATALEKAPLETLPEPRFQEALRVLVKSFNEESHAHLIGKFMFKGTLITNQIRQLMILDYLKQNPEIEAVPICKPLFIVGLPRTGTTLLQNLLALDPNARPLLGWEASMPAPSPQPGEVDQRRLLMAERSDQLKLQVLPDLASMHFSRARDPEECNGLFALGFQGLWYSLFQNLPSYDDWLYQNGMAEVYSFYKQHLQILARYDHNKHWLLKSPMHLGFLGDLMGTFPDANMIQTHRDPNASVPSYCSLIHYLRNMGSNHWRPEVTGRLCCDRLGVMVERAIAFRESADPARFLDLSYKRLVADPIASVREIYEYFGYPYSDAYEQLMKDYMAQNAQHKHGKHKYNLEQFGLDETGVRQTFATYHERFGSFL